MTTEELISGLKSYKYEILADNVSSFSVLLQWLKSKDFELSGYSECFLAPDPSEELCRLGSNPPYVAYVDRYTDAVFTVSDTEKYRETLRFSEIEYLLGFNHIVPPTDDEFAKLFDY